MLTRICERTRETFSAHLPHTKRGSVDAIAVLRMCLSPCAGDERKGGGGGGTETDPRREWGMEGRGGCLGTCEGCGMGNRVDLFIFIYLTCNGIHMIQV